MPEPNDTELHGGANPPPALKLPGDRYHVLRKLGSGSMGEVYLAEDTKLRRRVAIKSIRADRAAGGQILRRIKRECLLHARIGAHPHIVTLFDLHDEGDQLFLVMEYVEGDTLDHVLAAHRGEGRRFPIADSIDIVIQCLNGLAHVHARGIIHRDIKPANVILTRNSAGRYTAKIMDFGVARQEEQDPEVTTLTQPGGRSPGTPLYMAPEQIDASTYGEVTPASDIYAVGVLLYQLIAGQPPFTGSLTDVFNGHLNLEPRPIRFSDGTGPHPMLAAAIDVALQKQAARRYAGAADFAAQLEAIRPLAALESTPAQGGSGSIWAKAWHSSATRWIAAGAAGLSIAAIAFLGLRGGPEPAERETAGTINAAQNPAASAADPPALPPIEAPAGSAAIPSEAETTPPVDPEPLEFPAAEPPFPLAATAGDEPWPAAGPLLESEGPGIEIIEPIPGLETREIRDPYAAATVIEVPENGVEIVEAVDAPEGSPDADTTLPEMEAPEVVVAKAGPPGPEAVSIVPPATGGQTYTVLPGDTLALIARRFGLEEGDLAFWNELRNPDALRVGQTLYLYERPGLEPPAPEPVRAAPEKKESKPKEILRKTRNRIKGWID